MTIFETQEALPLSSNQKDVLIKIFVEGLSQRDTSLLLGITPQRVGQLKHEGVLRMMKLLKIQRNT